MRQEILNWNRKKNGKSWESFLEFFESSPVTQEEYDFILKKEYENGNKNFISHSESHFNPTRKCLNSIYNKDKFVEQDLTEIDTNFLNGEKINFKDFLTRIEKYPMSLLTLETLINIPNTTVEYDEETNPNVIKPSKRILGIANKLHKQEKLSFSVDKVASDFEKEITKPIEGNPMAIKVTKQIKDKAFELLKENPDGLTYSELKKKILDFNNDFNPNTINGSIWNLDVKFPKKVYKPSRGLFRLLEHIDPENDDLKKELKPKEIKKNREDKFYKPFLDWLQNDIEDVTHGIELGGNRFKDKWGTPDVIGKKESKRSDIIEAPVEIVSAEIKIDTGKLIIAFGQACAYKLFSHKCYLVVPVQSSQDEIARLDSLCQLFGIGLVLFDIENSKNPEFSIRVRPTKHEPDLFYTNKYMKKIEQELFR